MSISLFLFGWLTYVFLFWTFGVQGFIFQNFNIISSHLYVSVETKMTPYANCLLGLLIGLCELGSRLLSSVQFMLCWVWVQGCLSLTHFKIVVVEFEFGPFGPMISMFKLGPNKFTSFELNFKSQYKK